jgi:hypothetical protein
MCSPAHSLCHTEILQPAGSRQQVAVDASYTCQLLEQSRFGANERPVCSIESNKAWCNQLLQSTPSQIRGQQLSLGHYNKQYLRPTTPKPTRCSHVFFSLEDLLGYLRLGFADQLGPWREVLQEGITNMGPPVPSEHAIDGFAQLSRRSFVDTACQIPIRNCARETENRT